jgi:hypothetical protein
LRSLSLQAFKKNPGSNRLNENSSKSPGMISP